MRSFFAVVLVASVLAAAAAMPRKLSDEDRTALDDYVNKPDSNYKWFDTNITISGPGWTTYILNMTSQQWLTPAEVGDRSIWWHYVAVVVPDVITYKNVAGLYITGGYNTDGPPQAGSEDLELATALALTTGAPCATLFQIPNAPVYFTAEQPPKRRVEDAIIAYTWNHFINDPTEPEWLLRLPMTKAAVRAMDTVEAFLKEKKATEEITGFLVAGASKRGWTTWTTAAVDSRVIAAIPIVMDMLNFVENVHHFWRAYGGWTFALTDYYQMNFTTQLDNPNMQLLANIVDPYVYRKRLTMPKLVIDSTGDEFFMLDDNWYWWDNMTATGETHLIFIKNAEHSLATGIVEVVEAVSAFMHHVIAGKPRPTMTWEYGRNGTNGTISLVTSEKPKRVIIRHADTLQEERRDWRLITGANPCPWIAVKGECIQPVIWHGADPIQIDDTHYVAEMSMPEKGWRAWFLEVHFEKRVGEIDFIFSTQVDILPDEFPFPPCHGMGCKGTLL